MRETLLSIGQSYSSAKRQKISLHPIAQLISHRLKDDIINALGEYSIGLKVNASPGKGQWADVPWAAVFDPLITDRATEGYYVVYLFAPEKAEVHLSLNQGTTAIRDEFGVKGYAILKDRAELMRARLSDFASSFDTYNLELGYKTPLPKGYEAGHAFGRIYKTDSLPTDDILRADLQEMVKAYLALTFRGGLNSSTEATVNEDGKSRGSTITEIRQYRMHRRMDRHPSASKEAKSYHGTKCQACCFDFGEKYGLLGEGYIEAHHLRPLSTLKEGVHTKYSIADDFAVLCSNCHRMIHKTSDPSDLQAFREYIQQM